MKGVTRRTMLQQSAVLAAALALGCDRSRRRRGGLNVLILSSDEHNPRFMGGKGPAELSTPNLDALLGRGLDLTRVYTTAPVCAPTRSSLLTGLDPYEHGQIANQYQLDPRVPSLVQLFTDGGYATACFGKLHTQGDEENESFGWGELLNQNSGECWDNAKSRHRDGDAPAPVEDEADAAIFASIETKNEHLSGKVFHSETHSDDYVLVEEALRFMRDNAGHPFLCYVSLLNPHYPFCLPEAFYYLYDPDTIEMPEVLPGALDECPLGAWYYENWGFSTITEEQGRLIRARYMGAVSWMDHLLGTVIAELEALGLAEHTLVVYVSDHGDMVGEKGLWFKNVMYDDSARKPCILVHPDLPELAGQACPLLISECDLLPTLAGMVGLESRLTDTQRGQDLSPLIVDPTLWEDGPEAVFCSNWIQETGHPSYVMARGPRYKYVRSPDWAELYDMDEDPEENVNLAYDADHQDALSALSEQMDAFLASRVSPPYGFQPM